MPAVSNKRVQLFQAPFLLFLFIAGPHQSRAVAQSAGSAGDADAAPGIVRAASPSVVTIVLRDTTGRPVQSGSGFVVSNDGRVLTNAHVIQGSDTTQGDAKFQDGSFFQVQGIIAIDKERDLALIKLKAVERTFPALHLGNSHDVEVGQKVI